jgi:iron(III) transport system substrate-binding protein
MKRIASLVLGLGLALGLSTPMLAQSRTKLTIYTALENDQLAPFKTAIEKAVPEVEVEWVRDSTGVITARFLAEKDNPKADVVLGLAASSLLLFDQANLLDSYAPAGSDRLKAGFKDSTEKKAWTGMDAFLGVVCYNTVEGKKAGLDTPTSWKDLLDPKYRNQLVMPHPASSGTGYLTVAGWIETMGPEKAWEFMDELHKNIGVYTHSGSAPCVQAAKGERIAGISLDTRAAKEKSNGAPIEVVLPKEGVGWDVEGFAIVKGTQKVDLARKVADWAASKPANELYSKFYPIVADAEVKNLPTNYPADAESKMDKMDFAKMAAQREAVLKEWSRRYEGKAAPKN